MMNTELDYTNLSLLLAYLAGPLGVAAWMVFLSNAVRNLRESDPQSLNPINQELARLVRTMRPLQLQVLVTVLALGIPSIAKVILVFVPVEALERAQSTFAFIAMLMAVYIVQQVWFQVTKVSTPPSGTIIATTTAQKSTVTIAPPVEANEGFG